MNLNLMVFIQEIILLKMKDGTNVIIVDEYESTGTHWRALLVNANILIFSGLNIFQKKLKNS